MISGRVRPSSGSIFFERRDITGLRSWQRARSGIVYTFQITSIFPNLTCYDNVALAVQQRLMRASAAGSIWTRGHAPEGRRGLGARGAGRGDRQAGRHPALRPPATVGDGHGPGAVARTAHLDEPTQGLSESEIVGFCELVENIAGEVTVLLIEHNMPVVMALADRITVMDHGMVLAEGTPAEVQANADVRRAYLGA